MEADVWRNGNIWGQLRNPDMGDQQATLHFGPGSLGYGRDEARMEPLLAVVRLRSGAESPQYVTDNGRDFSTGLQGLIDRTTSQMVHYFSIAALYETAKTQDEKALYEATMIDGMKGAGIAFKHPQPIEMVPFFVRPDHDTPEGRKALCRFVHFLRLNPAWSQGNTIYPYPMHLAHTLAEDQFCILRMDD